MNIQTVTTIRDQRRKLEARIAVYEAIINQKKQDSDAQLRAGNKVAARNFLYESIDLLEEIIEFATRRNELADKELEAIDLLFTLTGEIPPPLPEEKDN